jgi:hypothetical protein
MLQVIPNWRQQRAHVLLAPLLSSMTTTTRPPSQHMAKLAEMKKTLKKVGMIVRGGRRTLARLHDRRNLS